MRRPDDTQKLQPFEHPVVDDDLPILDADQSEQTVRDLEAPVPEVPVEIQGIPPPIESSDLETETRVPIDDTQAKTRAVFVDDTQAKTRAVVRVEPIEDSEVEDKTKAVESVDGADIDDRTLPIAQPGALGDIANGRYLLARQIGRGGMGVVYEALDQQLNRLVALKVLGADQLNTEALGRFVIEARVAASIPHENICQLYDVGVDAQSGAPYMAMELLRGKDLEKILAVRGPLPIADACRYLMQTCSALAAAHRTGVVHRDVKLSNIFVLDGPAQVVKVLDFGVSKAPGFGDVTRLTQSGAMLGSPIYMSPEQIRNARGVDGRADIWSVGVVLYELLTGKPPFDGDSMLDLFEKVLTHDFVPVRSRRPDVPKLLEQVVMVTLQKERERRYASIDTLEKMLHTFAEPQAEGMARRGGTEKLRQ